MNGNPEFRRNLWIQFSETRVLVGALIVGLLLATAVALDFALAAGRAVVPELTALSARWLAIAILIFWAGRQAAGAVVREIHGRTWDAQRMSTIHPWSMAWGKLFGATSLSWLLALICLAGYAVARAFELSAANQPISAVAFTVVGLIGYGLFCQATGLLASMARLSGRPGDRGGSTTLAQFFGLCATGLLGAYAYWAIEDQGRWFGFALGEQTLRVITILHFAIWAVIGVYRRMRRELQMRSAPWAWLLFLIALTVYAEGLAYGRGVPPLAIVLPTAVTALLLWAINVIEAKDPLALRQGMHELRRGRLRAAAMLTPLWLVTYVVFAVVAAVSAAFAFGSGDSVIRFPPILEAETSLMVLGAFLLLTRDVFLVQYFSLGREGQFAGAYGALLSLVVYFAIPAVMIAAEQWRLLGIVLPTGQGGWALCLLPAGAQALLAVGLFIGRWRAFWRAHAAKAPTA